MKPISGLEIKKNVAAGEPLPAGGYVANIINAQVMNYSWGDVLVISFDIVEGEYKGFFSKQYNEDTREDKKWRGNYRLTIPQEKNKWFESQKRTFGNALACIEESNPGYHWNWDESSLLGMSVGVLIRDYEYDINGRTGWSTEACALASAQDIREKRFRQPKAKPLKNKPVTQEDIFSGDLSSFDDCPFN